MTTINGRACVANGRNLYLNSKTIADGYGINGAAKVTIEPFDSTTNMWHIVAAQGTGGGIYFFNYAKEKLPDTTDWSYSADVKGIGKPYMFGIEAGSHTPVVGTVGSEWSRISQSGRIVNSKIKTIAMYFSSTNSPVDVYIKLPKLEIGTTSTPLTPAPVDKVFSNGKQVYGRNLFSVRDWYSKPDLTLISIPYMNIKLEPSTAYTLTTNISLSPDGWCDVFFFKDNEVPSSGTNGVSSGIGRTLTTSSTGNVKVGLRNHSVSDGTNWIKLEKGTVATPWTLAPEDVM